MGRKMDDTSNIDLTKVPQHIAVIMDGNGRWATQQGKSRIVGHGAGTESVRQTLETAREIGVKFLTLYAFSTENWTRPKEEVDGLMDLLVQTIANEIDELNKSGVRLRAIGNIEQLPTNCKIALSKAIEDTQHNTAITLILALNYSAKWELVQAVKNIAETVKTNKLSIDNISDQLIDSYLTTSSYPDPELLIRTSGEHRLSNFLLWQCAYTELYFTPVLWPDFRKQHFIEAVCDYQQRERRFGGVSDAVAQKTQITSSVNSPNTIAE